MKRCKCILFNVCILEMVVILYTLNNMYIKSNTIGTMNEFFKCYFNDIICPLGLLSSTNLFLLTYVSFCEKIFSISVSFFKKMKYGIYSLRLILIYCVLCGIYWEFIYPIKHKNSTSDIRDVLCYMIGGIGYYNLYNLIKYKTKK